MKCARSLSLAVAGALGLCAGLLTPASGRSAADRDGPAAQCQERLEQGRYLQALSLCEQAVSRLDRPGADPLVLAGALDALAHAHQSQGRLASAEALFLRSLRLREPRLGPEHAEVAASLHGLASLYREQGDYVQAERLGLRALRIREKVLGPERAEVAASLDELASLYREQGELARAEPLVRKGLALREQRLGPEHVEVAASLGNLAALSFLRGAYGEAERLFLRCLQIRERALGADHSEVAGVLNGLAALYRAQGEPEKAEPLLLRSLRIWEKAHGPEHPNVASCLNNLALLYRSQGRYAQAGPLLLRSLRAWEKAVGPEHPYVADVLDNLAIFHLAQGQIEPALQHLGRVLSIRERSVRSASTEHRLTSLLAALRSEEDAIYSLLLGPAVPPAAAVLALRTSLLRKGRAAEAGLLTGWAVHGTLASQPQRERFTRWQALRSEHERLYLRGPESASPVAHAQRLDELKARILDLEQELALDAPQLAWRHPDPERILPELAQQLPPGSALIEILYVTPYLFQAAADEEKWGEPRYVALILTPDQRVETVDLGRAEAIDRAAGQFLLAVRRPEQDPSAQAQALYQKVLAPLLPKLGGASSLFLSPDGSLHLIPFAALHDGARYLVDSPYRFRYLSSGRDLLPRPLRQAEQPAVVLADPSLSTSGPGADGDADRAAPGQTDQTDPADRREGVLGKLARLAPLPGAREEGQLVARLLNVRPLLGDAATEQQLQQARSPWLVHLATHGLFIEDPRSALRPDSARGLRPVIPRDPAAAADRVLGRTGDPSLSRSMLVLAGGGQAARARDGAADGLLTAEEVRSLPLFGTQLVTLSACDSGRGSVRAGQGVYGLRRAFLMAGAETVVMSLWPVSDIGTQSLMRHYYQLLLDRRQPRGRISGLSEAMQKVKALHPHPYFWAPFIAIGLDAPLHPAPLRAR